MGDRWRASTGDIRSEPGDRRWRADRENGDRRQISWCTATSDYDSFVVAMNTADSVPDDIVALHTDSLPSARHVGRLRLGRSVQRRW
jgi:hypothetical protein